ncbi:MAG TPA: hypothetical protein VIL48_12215 [Acidimicrobiales bacterium]
MNDGSGKSEELAGAVANDVAAEVPLTRREKVVWYTVAAVSYIAVSIFQKGLLNWFVGPLWFVLVVWFGPPLARSLGRRRSAGNEVAL